MNLVLSLVIFAGLLAVLYGALQTASLMREPAGNDKMREIAAAIQEGAQAYLRRQYTTIAMVGVVILAVIFFLIGWREALGFLIGAFLSGLAGFAGMLISVRANVRTAQAASQSLAKGLSLAFRSGAVTGHAGRRLRPAGRRRLLRDPNRRDGAGKLPAAMSSTPLSRSDSEPR